MRPPWTARNKARRTPLFPAPLTAPARPKDDGAEAERRAREEATAGESELGDRRFRSATKASKAKSASMKAKP